MDTNFACEFCYRKGQEISLRCTRQSGGMNFCCYQHYCPEIGKNKLAAPWSGCRLLAAQDEKKK